MRISDWSSDVCSSDLIVDPERDRDERNARRAIQPLLDRPFFVARVAAAERDLELVAEVDGRLAEDRIAVDLIVGARLADLRSAAQQRANAIVASVDFGAARAAVGKKQSDDYPL